MPALARNCAPETRQEWPVKDSAPVGPWVGKPRSSAVLVMVATIACFEGAAPVLVGNSGAFSPKCGKDSRTQSTWRLKSWYGHGAVAAAQQHPRVRAIVSPRCSVLVGGRSTVTVSSANDTQLRVRFAASISLQRNQEEPR